MSCLQSTLLQAQEEVSQLNTQIVELRQNEKKLKDRVKVAEARAEHGMVMYA